MKSMRCCAFALLTAGAAWAGPAPEPVRAEIDALLGQLVHSDCRFQRNGRWHSGERARSHLLRKLRHIEERGTLHSTEQFIQLAASRSSSSNQPYRVACAGAEAVDSQLWLQQQLGALRARSR